MKLTILFLVLGFMQLIAGNARSQSTRLTLKLTDVKVEEVLQKIEEQSSLYFIYNRNDVNVNRKVNIACSDMPVTDILDKLFQGTNVEYEIQDRHIILKNNSDQVSQQISVSGKVTDSSGGSLPGVSVVLKGSTIGTITDAAGRYQLSKVPADATLQFSFVGMKLQEINIDGRSEINVALQEETVGIEEVVAVGYGTMRKSDLTGSITQVTSQDLTTVTNANPIQGLQGRASGVSVTTSDASPGGSPTIRIRGSGSISAGNDPLIVVDGFPLMNSNLNDISSNDIQSIEVLKDASSAAIYGSRGANGVILITTKKGSMGKNDLTVSGSLGINSPARLPQMLQHDNFVTFINDAYNFSTGAPVYSGSNPAPSYNTDWQREIIRNYSKTQNYSLAFSGGKDKTTYMLSGNVYSEDGMVQASGFNKYSLRNNLSHKFNRWLTIGTHMQVDRSQRDIRDNPTGDIFRYGWPTVPVKNPDGSWFYATEDPAISSYFEGTWNPVSEAAEVTNNLITDRILGDVYANFTLHKHLTFKTNFGVDISDAKNYQYYTSTSTAGIGSGNTGTGSQTYTRQTSRLTENILTYSNIWNNKHRFTATGVYSWQDYVYEDLNIGGSGFVNDATGANDISLASKESITYGSNKYSNRLISWTARATYAYNDKYMLTATGRYDGSSRFGANNKWGFFPSLGFGWRIDKESFLNDSGLISYLKLRTSYGVTGNQEIGNYSSLSKLNSVYYIYNELPLLGFTETIGNPDLKWERNIQYNIGLDVSFLKRIDLNLDYYIRKTSDLLYNVPIPTTSGYSSMLENIGEVKNTGLEITAHAKIIDRELKWDVTANISKNKNEVTKLYGDVTKINLGSSSAGIARYLVVGQPVNSVWARQSAGIISTQAQLDAYKQIVPNAQMGEEMYVDQKTGPQNTPDGKINSDDYINIGSTEPDFYYGISTNLSWKKLSLDIYGQGASGIASSSDGNYMIYGENQIQNRNYIPTQYAYERMWSETNPNGTFPRAGAQNVYLSDRTNGGWKYFIVKNIRLGYDLSSIIQRYNWIKELTVYVNAQNYISFANNRGYNPETGSVDFPWAKTMTFGINAKF